MCLQTILVLPSNLIVLLEIVKSLCYNIHNQKAKECACMSDSMNNGFIVAVSRQYVNVAGVRASQPPLCPCGTR